MIACLFAVFTLNSCLMPNMHSVLESPIGIKMGMTTKDFLNLTDKNESELDKSWDWMSYDIDVNNQKYTAIVTPIATGNISEQITLPATSTYNKISHQYIHHDYTNNYYFIFKNDSLMYWGFLYEFVRHPNSEIENIGTAIVKLQKQEASK